MKKLVFAFAALVAVSFAACTGNTQPTDVAEVDSCTVEEVVDSVAEVVDSLVEVVDSVVAE